MMEFDAVDIRELIPQKAPFVMIDGLSYADMSSAVCLWTISDDALFVHDGQLLPCAILENMAQTCAAHLGYVEKYVLGNNDVKIGFIGSVNNFSVYSVPRVGDMLETRVEIVEQIMDMKLMKSVSYINGQLAAKTELKIALTDKTAL